MEPRVGLRYIGKAESEVHQNSAYCLPSKKEILLHQRRLLFADAEAKRAAVSADGASVETSRSYALRDWRIASAEALEAYTSHVKASG
jgi:hypothetical protein